MPKARICRANGEQQTGKTVVVRVGAPVYHPVMKKTVRSSKKYYAHDETNACAVGDRVKIEEHAPISKLKRWIVCRATDRRP